MSEDREDMSVSSPTDIIASCLNEWNMGHLYPIFIANEIDVSLFLELDLNYVNLLLPEETVGARMKLLKNISELKVVPVNSVTLEKTAGGEAVPAVDESEQLQQDVRSSPSNNRKRTLSDNPSNDRASDVDFDPDESDSEKSSDASEPLSDLARKIKTSKQVQPSKIKKRVKPTMRSHPVRTDKTKEKIVELDSDKRLVNPNLLSSKKSETLNLQQQLMDLDLRDFLKSSLEGKAILNSYDINAMLEDDERNVLVDIVVKWLLFRTTTPRRDDFITLRDKILALFESEINVYYIPPKEQGDHQTLARGKLFDRSRNLKEWMRKKGLLARVKGQGQRNLESVEANTCLNDPNIELTQEVKDALDWLKIKREPWDKVKEKWIITSKYRMTCLTSSSDKEGKDGKSVHKVQSYSNSYKVLMEPRGYLLIDIDFMTLFGDTKAEQLVVTWPKFKRAIIRIVKEKPSLINDVEGKNILQLLLRQPTDDTECILVFKLLASLMPATRKVQLGSKKFKPSIKESRDALLVRVTTPAEVSNQISNIRTSTQKQYGTKASVQPYILYVATEEEVAKDFYVIIDNFAYKLSNVVHAVDVCFKTFFTMDLGYPAQSEHLWLFMQQVLYQIETKNDVDIHNVKTFAKRVTLVMQGLSNES